MLQLRPTCENCNCALPPESTLAMICTFECTFCKDCVSLLENVCPNCGGGFCQRPIRPVANLKGDNYLGKYPSSSKIVHKPVHLGDHAALATKVKGIAPENR